MRICVIVLALLALVLPAHESLAQLTVSKRDCKRITKHLPAPDVAYQPGSGVRGKKFAPADLGGASPIKIPDEISINIGIDLEEKYGLGAGGKYTGEAIIGKVTVKKGRVYFNGQPLTAPDQAVLAQACREKLKKGK